MSDPARPEVAAFRELEQLVRNLGDELATFRQRALAAEARLKELDGVPGATGGEPGAGVTARIAELEEENSRLKGQIESATARTRVVLDRVRFLRQQARAAVGG